MTDLIRVRGLTVERDGVFILRDISWTVRAGEHWVLLGANGSGKTSLLRALMGYLHGPGEIDVLGEGYGRSVWQDVRARVGLVSSAIEASIPNGERAWETVATGRSAQLGQWGELASDDEPAARALLDALGVGELADRRWDALSQGERKRVLIARARRSRLGLLVLDEPCSGLDPVAREDLLVFIERLAQTPGGPGMVLVTHHVDEIVPVFTHVLLLAQGRVLAAGPKTEVLTDAALSNAFGARVAVEEREGRWTLRVVR